MQWWHSQSGSSPLYGHPLLALVDWYSSSVVHLANDFILHPHCLRFVCAATVRSPPFCFFSTPPWYRTMIPACSLPITSPSHHSDPLSEGHLTLMMAPWPIHCMASAGRVCFFCWRFFGLDLLVLGLGVSWGMSTDPARFRPCQWVEWSSYFTLTPGVPLSSGHSSFVTFPLHQRPLWPPSLSPPPSSTHATLTLVPTAGTQCSPGEHIAFMGRGVARGQFSVAEVSADVSFLVPWAHSLLRLGSWSARTSLLIDLVTRRSMLSVSSSSGFAIPRTSCCHLLLASCFLVSVSVIAFLLASFALVMFASNSCDSVLGFSVGLGRGPISTVGFQLVNFATFFLSTIPSCVASHSSWCVILLFQMSRDVSMIMVIVLLSLAIVALSPPAALATVSGTRPQVVHCGFHPGGGLFIQPILAQLAPSSIHIMSILWSALCQASIAYAHSIVAWIVDSLGQLQPGWVHRPSGPMAG